MDLEKKLVLLRVVNLDQKKIIVFTSYLHYILMDFGQKQLKTLRGYKRMENLM